MNRIEDYYSEKDKFEAAQEKQEPDAIDRAMQQKEMERLRDLEYRNKEIDLYDRASNKLAKNEWLRPEVWRNKSETEKRIALEYVGRDLSRVYKSPAPDIFVTEKEKTELGSYDDENWRININKKGEHRYIIDETRCGGKLFGDDPRAAFHTYCHEYRHSYQREQALRYEKNLGFVDNPEKAKNWAENYRNRNYVEAPKPELARTDPERYRQEYEKYTNQPVEKDANQFADGITKRVYYRFSFQEGE